MRHSVPGLLTVVLAHALPFVMKILAMDGSFNNSTAGCTAIFERPDDVLSLLHICDPYMCMCLEGVHCLAGTQDANFIRWETVPAPCFPSRGLPIPCL